MLVVSDRQVLVRPNNSLSPQGAIRLVLGLSVVSMSVGAGFALAGAWMVLPFAGLEIVAIGYAFYYVLQHSSDYESIVINDEQVIVEKFEHKKIVKTVFQRYWAKVILREQQQGRQGLFIGSHGKELEFGKYLLDDEQRVILARELKEKIKYIH